MDYSLFPVLPMAIANDVIIAFISEEGGTTIELANTRSEYASCCFDIPQENGSKLEVRISGPFGCDAG